jgi:hypothetical protein
LNVAVTLRAVVMLVMVQVAPLVESQPDHDEKVPPELGVAVSVMVLVRTKLAVHVAPQLIWFALSGVPGEDVDVTVPPPPPASVTATGK